MAKQRDGLGSSISPATAGASGEKGLPPRTHAIHLILYYSQMPLTLEEIEQQLRTRGYEEKTVAVTIKHLNSLLHGSESYINAVPCENGCYRLTENARQRLEKNHKAW